jgi:hypothetical protein
MINAPLIAIWYERKTCRIFTKIASRLSFQARWILLTSAQPRLIAIRDQSAVLGVAERLSKLAPTLNPLGLIDYGGVIDLVEIRGKQRSIIEAACRAEHLEKAACLDESNLVSYTHSKPLFFRSAAFYL